MYRMKIFYILLSIILLTSSQAAKSQAIGVLPDSDPGIVKFYPNPATSYIIFEIEKESGKTYDLQIYNFLGRQVKEIHEINAKTTINVTDLNRGLYIFQLKEPNGRVVESGRFQVNK